MLGRTLLVIIPLVLSGCAEISTTLTAASSLSRMWFDWPPEPPQVAGPPLPETPVYCYRTLAEAVCYASPLTATEDETRLIGHFGPDPHVP